MAAVLIVGDGPMGQAFASRLAVQGVSTEVRAPRTWTANPYRDGAELIVLALHAGQHATTAVREVVGRREKEPFCLVDLTTQTPTCAATNAEMCRGTKVRYYGGGVLGGADQAREGSGVFLLGPPLNPGPQSALIECLGTVVEMPSAPAAAGAKLLHNLVLIVQSHILGVAFELVLQVTPLTVQQLAKILDVGPVGRRPSASSAARDRLASPTSSYSGTLVAKDLAQMAASFPALDRVPGINLAALAQTYAKLGHKPYTCRTWSPHESP